MKKIIKLLLTIPALLFAFSNSRCSKGKEDCFDCTDGPRDTLYIEKDFLDYWYAETGSWWVFKRTDTVGVDMYDTLRVVAHKRKIEFRPGGIFAYENILIRFSHSLLNFKDSYLKDALIGCEDNVATITASYIPNQGILIIEYPFYNNGTKNSFYEHFDNFTTPFATLGEVVKITDKKSPEFSIYFSSSVGICRIEHADNSIWELVDCNVIRTQ